MIGGLEVLRDDPAHVARLKRRVLRSSRPTRPRDLEAIHTLAIAMFIWQRTHMLNHLLEQVMPLRFEDDFNVWSPIERCKALYAFTHHEGGNRTIVKKVRAEIQTAGYCEDRRRGLLLGSSTGYRHHFRQALEEGDRVAMLGWGVPYVGELAFIWVMGGSLRLPRRKVRSELERVVLALKERPPTR